MLTVALLAAAALLCVAVLAGCSSGVAHDHAAAPGASASGTSHLAHPATTPVPPPVHGNIHQTVRAVTVPTKPPVSLRAVAHFGTGVTAQIMSVKAIEYHADGKPKRVEFFAPSDYHPIAQWGPVLPGSNNQ